MIVVSDTSVITNLAAIDQISLLNELYERVCIPEAVYAELVGPPISAGGEEAQLYEWIQVYSVDNRVLVNEFLEILDIGESEAIALALELDADLLLIDERQGRQFAESKGIKITGVLGVLITAKKKGLVTELRPLIEKLRNQADFWLSESLCNRVLRDAGEKAL